MSVELKGREKAKRRGVLCTDAPKGHDLVTH